MNRLMGVLLTVVIVPIVLNIITARAVKSNTSSIYNFCMKPSGGLAVIGGIGLLFFAFCIFASYIGEQFKGATAVIFVGLALLSLFIMLFPVKGFWDVTVKGNDITSNKLWVLKRTIHVQDIDYCERTNKGTFIYVKEKKDPVIGIDIFNINQKNFENRMKKEGIEIRTRIDA